MISYAQNFEDVMLRRVFRDKKDGFYIDVGAMDPVVDSVTKLFYEEGWSGINIEPNPFFYSKLLKDRPRDINLNIALGEREEYREFHVFEQIGNSTFDEASRDRSVEAGFPEKPVSMKVTTLAAVCQNYVRRSIDFLKIDCEGWEKFVLRGADWDRFRPAIILVEATEPHTSIASWEDWESDLTGSARYEAVYFDGLNRFYLAKEYLEFLPVFALPPNVFDGFTLYSTTAAQEQNQLLIQERDGLTSQITQLNESLTKTSQALANQQAEIERLQRVEGEHGQLTAIIAELEANSSGCRQMLEEAEKRQSEMQARVACLEEELKQSRLWIGRLSQEVVSGKLIS